MEGSSRGLRALVGMVLALEVVLSASLWALQERVIFPGAWMPGPTADALRALAVQAGAQHVDLPAADGTRLAAWYTSAGGQRVVVYVGGNAESLAAAAGLSAALREAGWDTLAVSPRGFPGSSGEPSEEGFADDVDGALAWLAARGLGPDRVILHGRSLGGGVMTAAAARHHPAALVLESTFTSVRAMARRRVPVVPVDALLRHPFDNLAHVDDLPAAVFVAHARGDEVVPFSEGEALARAIPGARWHPGAPIGHQRSVILADPDVRDAWRRFLDEVAATIDTKPPTPGAPLAEAATAPPPSPLTPGR